MKPVLSIITPVFNEAANLRELHRRLVAAMPDCAWEWIAVDDASTDESGSTLATLARDDARIQVRRLARNGGSHAALFHGLAVARGDAVAMLAADLQDPPEMLPPLFARWQAGASVVWAARRGPAPDATRLDRLLSRCFYLALRHGAGLRRMPPHGADFVLLDQSVVTALRRLPAPPNLFIPILKMPVRQESISYEKHARAAGRSGWTFRQKVALLRSSFAAARLP